jgi:hypothetical protein
MRIEEDCSSGRRHQFWSCYNAAEAASAKTTMMNARKRFMN